MCVSEVAKDKRNEERFVLAKLANNNKNKSSEKYLYVLVGIVEVFGEEVLLTWCWRRVQACCGQCEDLMCWRRGESAMCTLQGNPALCAFPRTASI